MRCWEGIIKFFIEKDCWVIRFDIVISKYQKKIEYKERERVYFGNERKDVFIFFLEMIIELVLLGKVFNIKIKDIDFCEFLVVCFNRV